MANVTDKVVSIRNAIYGKDVRESLASGIEVINAEVESTTSRQNDIDQNEGIRITSEIDRVSSENTRKSNETARITAENTRKTNETARIAAESVRVTNETDRVSSENTRKTNETSRQNYENVRVTNESERTSSENTRKSNETVRITSETDRTSSENIRKTNEMSRVNAENIRITNEQYREETFNAMTHAEPTLEIVEARGGKPALKDRFSDIETNVAENTVQLSESVNNLNTREVNVKYPPAPMVGAKGDGVTDDTVAIQNMIDNYDNIVLPEGTYKVSSLNVGNYKKINGCGSEKTLILFTGGIGINVTGAFSKIANLKIGGYNTDNSIGLNVNFIPSGGIFDCYARVENVHVNSVYYGIKVEANSRGVLINDCLTSNTHIGITFGCTDGFLDNCTCYNSVIGIDIYQNNTATNCKSFYCTDAGIRITGINNCISSCSVQNCQNGLILLSGAYNNNIQIELDMNAFYTNNSGSSIGIYGNNNNITACISESVDHQNQYIVMINANTLKNNIVNVTSYTSRTINTTFSLYNDETAYKNNKVTINKESTANSDFSIGITGATPIPVGKNIRLMFGATMSGVTRYQSLVIGNVFATFTYRVTFAKSATEFGYADISINNRVVTVTLTGIDSYTLVCYYQNINQ